MDTVSTYLYPLSLAATHLDLFEVMGTEEMFFFWISEILNSGYPEEERYSVASEMVRLLGPRYCGSRLYTSDMQPAWIITLLNFLSLCENFSTTESPPHPGLVALHIISFGPRDADLGTALLPILTPMLSPHHPLRSREPVLTVFCRFMRGWFSSQMETISGHRPDQFLRAVGDPFHLPLEPFQDQRGELERTVHYSPMEAVIVLIGFASSDLWRNHLRPSNFASCEDFVSTEEGRKFALRLMFLTASAERPEFLCTPAKTATAIRRLEELGCSNTARVVIMWVWTVGMTDATSRDGKKLIEDETLLFYKTHGIRSLATLKRHIIQNTSEGPHYTTSHYELFPLRVGRSRRVSNPPSIPTGWTSREVEEWETDYVISQACQLKRLYHLFGHDPTTWQEAVGVEEVDEEGEVLSEHPVYA